ncbi:hypothetical protein LXL04_001696 [Taraxacum kok-saghyz]
MSWTPSKQDKNSPSAIENNNHDHNLKFSPLRKLLPLLHETSIGKSLGSSEDEAILVGAIAGASFLLFLILIVVCCCCCFCRNKRKQKHKSNGDHKRKSSDIPLQMPPYQAPLGTSSFKYDDLATATRGFDKSMLLGQGGFGYVYKGVLPNGKKIAVKTLKANSRQGEREFQAEVDIISGVHHHHLVSLDGYCISGDKRLLVYEYIPNRTLDYHLHRNRRSVIDCSTRLKIALGAAKGFAYLHEECNPRIIHRDIKAANILIDSQYEAKVADFGLAKLSYDNNTHVSTRVMGTFGYLAPEYAKTGKLTEKSDVFSYGVMLLELITGRRPVEPDSDVDCLIDWAGPTLMQASEGGSYEDIVDPRLGVTITRRRWIAWLHVQLLALGMQQRNALK